MATTREQVVSYDKEIPSLMTRKRVIKEGKAPKDMAHTLCGALEIQRQKVEKLTTIGNVDIAARSEGSSSGYRSS